MVTGAAIFLLEAATGWNILVCALVALPTITITTVMIYNNYNNWPPDYNDIILDDDFLL